MYTPSFANKTSLPLRITTFWWQQILIIFQMMRWYSTLIHLALQFVIAIFS